MKAKGTLVVVVLAVVVGAIVAAVRLLEDGSSEAGSDQTHEVFETVIPTPEEPVFEGELLGIRFVSEERLAVEGSGLTQCPDPPEIQAKSLISGENKYLPAPVYLPSGAAMPPVTRGLYAPPNPGVVMCLGTDQPISAWRHYDLPSPGTGETPYVFIAREFGPLTENVPYRASELEQIEVGGHPVIRVGAAEEIATSDPWETVYYIPDASSLTTIRTHEVPLDEADKIAESVVESLFSAPSQ